MSVQKQATNSVYQLNDGTGSLEARHWFDATGQEGQDSEDDVECVPSSTLYPLVPLIIISA
jgi:replication factor A2